MVVVTASNLERLQSREEVEVWNADGCCDYQELTDWRLVQNRQLMFVVDDLYERPEQREGPGWNDPW